MRTLVVSIIVILLSACSPLADNNESLQMAANDNVQLGLAYLQQNDVPRAKEKFLLACQQAPKWPVALDAMAYFLEQTDDNAGAATYYQRAIVYSPKDGGALNNYGAFLCRNHNPQQAIEALLRAVRDPNYINSAEAYENAGLCALTIPDQEQAKYFFTKALQQDPSRQVARNELEKLHA
jgi:type IV pilus assembly protein PilF